jgi:hypothetical protein
LLAISVRPFQIRWLGYSLDTPPILIRALEDEASMSVLRGHTALAAEPLQDLFFEENVPSLM